MSYPHTSKSTKRKTGDGSAQLSGQQLSSQQQPSQLSSHYKASRAATAARPVSAKNTEKKSSKRQRKGKASAGASKAGASRTGASKAGASKTGAPLFIKRYVRWLFGKRSEKGAVLPRRARRAAPQKVAIATGSIATLALLAVVPGKVSSQSIADNTCQEVVQSGAEISRGDLTSLSDVAAGTPHETVRELIDKPYCLLPLSPESAAKAASDEPIVAREAYPLAFDPEAWVVVNYAQSGYTSYDFAFKQKPQ